MRSDGLEIVKVDHDKQLNRENLQKSNHCPINPAKSVRVDVYIHVATQNVILMFCFCYIDAMSKFFATLDVFKPGWVGLD